MELIYFVPTALVFLLDCQLQIVQLVGVSLHCVGEVALV